MFSLTNLLSGHYKVGICVSLGWILYLLEVSLAINVISFDFDSTSIPFDVILHFEV